jgi:phosphoesterase RecJ-like protein
VKLTKISRRAAILLHQNADPDALCSGYALGFLLKKLNKKISVDVIASGGANKVAKGVLSNIHVRLREPEDLKAYDVVFTVDTNTFSQLGIYAKHIEAFEGEIVIVDHHNPDPNTCRASNHALLNENATSTAEIIYTFYKQLRIPLTRSVALALFLGIAYDTRHFVLATPNVFRIASDLAEAGIDTREAIRILQIPMTESEKMARLKASQRLQITRAGPWILAFTQVSSHHASAARALTMLGADVAVAAGGKKRQIQASLRSTQEFYNETGIHLGRDIARPVGELVRGTGGGHALSSGIRGEGIGEKILEECLNAMIKKLERGK